MVLQLSRHVEQVAGSLLHAHSQQKSPRDRFVALRQCLGNIYNKGLKTVVDK